MPYPNNIAATLTAAEIIDRFTMIVGDINSGKTTLTKQILEVLCKTKAGVVTVFDFAPEITSQDLKAQHRPVSLGGALQIPDSEGIRYYRPRIHPPRLRARDEREAETLAAKNLRAIEAVLEEGLRENTDAIFINDCSLYLHSGSASRLLDVIHRCPTSVVNGYLGRFFDDSPISTKERNGMELLMRHCDRLIRL